MAKFECVVPSGYSFNDILQYFHTHLTKNHGECTGSSDYSSERARVAVRVYERYSWSGGNRVSMSMTLAGRGDELFLSAITSGGSQAMFFKVNTWGEEAFLDTLLDVLQHL